MDRNKIIKMLVILAAITVVAGGLTRMAARNSMSLTEYVEQNGSTSGSDTDDQESSSDSAGDSEGENQSSPRPTAEGQAVSSGSQTPQSSVSPEAQNPSPTPQVSQLTGASLNGTSQLERRTLLADGFYFEPVSDSLRRYMTGISYPSYESDNENFTPVVTFEELRYVHILHYDFEGIVAEGELVCNQYIAQDLVEIFYELYRNEYQLERVLLIDEYDGDDIASMEDNNTSCFNYRTVEGTKNLSKHAYGLAIDINPLYNPYITYEKDGSQLVSPVTALPYADRSAAFPYKINEDDLCYKLFMQHGFIWGGNWNNRKDYQHFQKALP